MVTKERIRQYLYGLGMCAVGFTHAGPFKGLEGILSEERCRPRLHFPWVNTIISVAYPYRLYETGSHGNLKGTVSSSALGEDYHRLLRRKLGKAAEFISRGVKDFRYEIMVDTGPLADREIAYRAGLGWYGKNCLIIVPSIGSAVYLGEMLINIVLEPDRVLEKGCGACTRCIDNCPTGALAESYRFDAQRCISYLTQKRGIIPRRMREKIGDNLYGCDECLVSCPHNSSISHNNGETAVDLHELIGMNRNEFNKKYGESAWGWRGLNVLKRNATLVLGNKRKESGLAPLGTALKQPSPMVRGHAAWAIGRIGGPRALGLLKESLDRERDEYVIEEINAALGELKL